MVPRHALTVLVLCTVLLVTAGSGVVTDTASLDDTTDTLDSSSTEDSTVDDTDDNTLDTDTATEQYIIHLTDDGNYVAELEERGVTVRYDYDLIDAVAITMDPALEDTVRELAFVERIEEDAVTEPVLAQSTSQINARQVWTDHGVTGDGVTVAVLDTGIADHPDLQNVVDHQDFTGEGPDDNNGHGTHVASTIAGSGEASGGTYRGVADGADLMNVKVLDRTGSGRMSDAIAGMEYATSSGADILSLSIGASVPCNGNDAMSMAADAAVERGVVVVAAAGNNGPAERTITSPGCAERAITVGAVDPADNMASFSSRGPTLDDRVKPDVVAPGVLITAASHDGGYTAKSGTSMATPHVSGVTALQLSAEPDLSPAQVKDTIMETAEDIGADEHAQGAGRVDAAAAFSAATGRDTSSGTESGQQDAEDDQDQRSERADRTEEDREREQASRTAQDDTGMDDVHNVQRTERNGTTQYQVTGRVNSSYVDVWVDAESDTVTAVEEVGRVRGVLLRVRDFIDTVLGLF